jgi:hypothetical protein
MKSKIDLRFSVNQTFLPLTIYLYNATFTTYPIAMWKSESTEVKLFSFSHVNII